MLISKHSRKTALLEVLEQFTGNLIEKHVGTKSRKDILYEFEQFKERVRNIDASKSIPRLKSTNDSYTHEEFSTVQNQTSREVTVNFVNDMPGLNSVNRELGKLLLQVFFDDNIKCIFLNLNKTQFFSSQKNEYLGDFILLNCFISLLVGFIYGENVKEFTKFTYRLTGGATSEVAKVCRKLIDLNNKEAGFLDKLDALKSSILDNQNFCNAAIIAVKDCVHDFLKDLKRRNSESYKTKYYRLKELMTTDSIQIEDNEEMYKLIRYTVEAFYLAFDSFCELIFLKNVDNDYLLKKIFINRAKNVTRRKNKLFLVQIDGKFCLFCNFKIEEALLLTNKSEEIKSKNQGSKYLDGDSSDVTNTNRISNDHANKYEHKERDSLPSRIDPSNVPNLRKKGDIQKEVICPSSFMRSSPRRNSYGINLLSEKDSPRKSKGNEEFSRWEINRVESDRRQQINRYQSSARNSPSRLSPQRIDPFDLLLSEITMSLDDMEHTFDSNTKKFALLTKSNNPVIGSPHRNFRDYAGNADVLRQINLSNPQFGGVYNVQNNGYANIANKFTGGDTPQKINEERPSGIERRGNTTYIRGGRSHEVVAERNFGNRISSNISDQMRAISKGRPYPRPSFSKPSSIYTQNPPNQRY